MTAVTAKLTPTEQRILAVLSDGRGHDRAELTACMEDELAAAGALNVHLTRMRKKIQPQGYDIVCQQLFMKKTHFRLVRLISTDG